MTLEHEVTNWGSEELSIYDSTRIDNQVREIPIEGTIHVMTQEFCIEPALRRSTYNGRYQQCGQNLTMTSNYPLASRLRTEGCYEGRNFRVSSLG